MYYSLDKTFIKYVYKDKWNLSFMSYENIYKKASISVITKHRFIAKDVGVFDFFSILLHCHTRSVAWKTTEWPHAHFSDVRNLNLLFFNVFIHAFKYWDYSYFTCIFVKSRLGISHSSSNISEIHITIFHTFLYDKRRGCQVSL